MANNNQKIGKIVKQQRLLAALTLHQLSIVSGVSPSHLGRIERDERFPSARTLRKIAQPLGFRESELFVLAGYFPPSSVEIAEKHNGNLLDPYAASILTQEPARVQRAVVVILGVLKSFADNLNGTSD